MSTKITFQELEFLKVENQKLKENLTKFVKRNQANDAPNQESNT